MSTIDIKPADYLKDYSHWDMLVRYLEDNSYLYHYNTGFTREEITGLLMDMTAEAFREINFGDGYNPRNLLDRAIIALASGGILILSRANLLRLILALGINNKRKGDVSTSLQEANNFLLNYMHESELSARNLKECIFIWALHNNMSVNKIVTMIHDNEAAIMRQPINPTGDEDYEGGTEDVLNLLIDLKSQDEFERFISSHRSFFTKLGNTHYCSLFSDICIFPVTRRGTETLMMIEYEPDEDDDSRLIPSYLRSREQSDRLQRERYYERLFGIYSLDDETYDNHLNKKTIKRLTALMPDVFMTETRFTNLIQRKTVSDVPYGVHLLHMLIDMPFETYVPVQIVKKNPRTGEIIETDPVGIFKDACDFYLNNVGFASMNRAVPIDKLVLDVYRLTIESRESHREGEIHKDLFLRNFREALKMIADTCAS